MTMMTETHPETHHPSRPALLAFAIIAGPLIWSLHLFVNYGFASHVCFPGAAPIKGWPHGEDWLWTLLTGVDLAGIAIAALAAFASYAIWRPARREYAGSPAHSRVRFLALWGIMTSAGFVIAIAFDLVGILVLQSC
jgi:hypothetical protein